MASLTRRDLIAVAAGMALGGPLAVPARGRTLGAQVKPGEGRTVTRRFVAAERATALPCFGGPAFPLWTFDDGAWPPVIRLDLGDKLDVILENRLPRENEHTSIHWHGIRLPNDQDGVPYLVQPPVRPGESFRYSFEPPDAGTYFFHTHCNTVEQLGRGLEGILIIDGDTTEPYDSDHVLLLRDWRVQPGATQFDAFTTARGAGRAGSYGALRSVNGAVNPQLMLPAEGDCRLRLIHTDPTRIMEITIEGADASAVAIDGIAVEPFPLSTWPMGPGMRLDVVIRSPPDGATARVIDLSGGNRTELARLTGSGGSRRRSSFDPAPLRAGRVPTPDLPSARRLEFRFGTAAGVAEAVAAADGLGVPLDSLCLSARALWTINGKPWPTASHDELPPPLATLEKGRTYLFELKNDSLFSHPVHIHGHFFTVLSSSKRQFPAHHADTYLLQPGETAHAALVADGVGKWMLHCHIIEHQENGMMGYLEVA